jgi:hypothetical protein
MLLKAADPAYMHAYRLIFVTALIAGPVATALRLLLCAAIALPFAGCASMFDDTTSTRPPPRRSNQGIYGGAQGYPGGGNMWMRTPRSQGRRGRLK